MNIKRFAVPVIPALVAAIALGALPQRLKHSYASDAPITEPVIFGEGVISTEDFDDYFAFTPDGNTIYFTKHKVDFGGGTIVVSHFRDGKWTTPEVAPFSGQYEDGEPLPQIQFTQRTALFVTRPLRGKNNSFTEARKFKLSPHTSLRQMPG